jgi:hypothetical protein
MNERSRFGEFFWNLCFGTTLKEYAPRVLQHSPKFRNPVLDQLAQLGYQLRGLSDLRHQGKPWKSALPILLNWLPKIDDPGVKEDIVRGLSVPWIGNKATPELIEEFKVYAQILPSPSHPWAGKKLRDIPVEEKKLASAYSLAWAIENALSIV